MVSSADLAAYLARIGLAGRPPRGGEGLRAVQAAHRQRIPFENIDVRLGRTIAIDSHSLIAKLIHGQRGGFCFEHNLLLGAMLAALGFPSRILLARVLLGNPSARPPAMPPRTHCLVLVDLAGEQWIADAGFGGSYAPPMRLAEGALSQSGDGAQHRLRRLGEEGQLPGSWLLERRGPRLAGDGRARSDHAWEAQYAFDLAEVAKADLALGCHWAASHAQSRFTNHTVVSRCLADGFISLIDRDLTVYRAGQQVEQPLLADAAQLRAALANHFALALSPGDAAALWGLT